MSKTPKVSICIPTYNNADEVERLLQSIAAQEYTDYEVNISDDSTNDEIQRLAQRYPEINYVHNAKPLGHIFNWNMAIKMAKGEYIKIMFSDDWFTDCKSLGRFAGMLDAAPNVLLAFSGSRQALLGKQSFYDRHASREFIRILRQDYRTLFTGNQIGAPSAVIYRRGASLTLFDERSNWASDMFLYFELLQKNAAFVYTKKPLVSIGVHAQQYTESFSEKDMRIYNDYKYMYTKYNLKESAICRAYFTEKFIVKYNQGTKEAKALGIESALYWKKYAAELLQSVKCFVRHRLHGGRA